MALYKVEAIVPVDNGDGEAEFEVVASTTVNATSSGAIGSIPDLFPNLGLGDYKFTITTPKTEVYTQSVDPNQILNFDAADSLLAYESSTNLPDENIDLWFWQIVRVDDPLSGQLFSGAGMADTTDPQSKDGDNSGQYLFLRSDGLAYLRRNKFATIVDGYHDMSALSVPGEYRVTWRMYTKAGNTRSTLWIDGQVEDIYLSGGVGGQKTLRRLGFAGLKRSGRGASAFINSKIEDLACGLGNPAAFHSAMRAGQSVSEYDFSADARAELLANFATTRNVADPNIYETLTAQTGLKINWFTYGSNLTWVRDGDLLPNQVEQNNIVFTFDTAPTEKGNYIDGPAYVVMPTGTISSVTPEQSTDSYGVTNGAMLNPQNQEPFAFDDYFGGDKRVPDTFPMSVAAGDIVIKARSLSEAQKTDIRNGVCKDYAGCYILSTAPAANEFSPTPLGWTGRGTPQGHVVDLKTIVAGLPSYDVSGFATAAPSFDRILSPLSEYAPLLSLYRSDSPDSGYEAVQPYGFGGISESNYGLNPACVINTATLALVSNAYTAEQKWQLLIYLIRLGINSYDTWSNVAGAGTSPGGHFQFWAIPAVLALHATGRSSLVDNLDNLPSNEVDHPFQITQAFLDELVPHDDRNGPYLWRRRTITSVNGNEIGFDYDSTDQYRYAAENMLLTREADGATATITSTNPAKNGHIAGKFVITIDAQPAQPFQVGDVVYSETSYPLRVGDYHWSITGNASGFSPSPSAQYRRLQAWSGGLLGLWAMGYPSPQLESAVKYSKWANGAPPDPALPNFPHNHGSNRVSSSPSDREWRREFWDTYAPTAFGAFW